MAATKESVDVLFLILSRLPEYRPATARVCRAWHRVATDPLVTSRSPPLKPSQLAERGHVDLLARAIARTSPTVDTCNAILLGATAGGHQRLCELALAWGAADVDGMLREATYYRRLTFCQLARARGATAINDMLCHAAVVGDEDLCRLAREWGATNFNTMLCLAGACGSERLARLAREWGADSDARLMVTNAAHSGHDRLVHLGLLEWNAPVESNRLLAHAAAGGRASLCELARSRGADAFDSMMAHAAASGRLNICILAKEWGATDFNQMLECGAQYNCYGGDVEGARHVCTQARAWGATAFDGMLRQAASVGRDDLCRLAREWGATDFAGMLDSAQRSKHVFAADGRARVVALAHEWLGERDDTL
jgi:hypothetical protein